MKYAVPLVSSKFYHIYNHAVGNENLFREDANYLFFLKKFSTYIYPFCSTYAYCLMPNHFHLLILVRDEEEIIYNFKELKNLKTVENIPPTERIVMQQFSNFLNGYAKAYNIKYKRKGALFLDYLRRIEITDETYFTRLINYIHSNPIHHGFTKKLEDWIYSSYHAIISPKPSRLAKEEVITWFGGTGKFIDFHQLNTIHYKDQEIDILEFA